jgi:HTH-type transcriptional regulator / antitoxin HipB
LAGTGPLPIDRISSCPALLLPLDLIISVCLVLLPFDRMIVRTSTDFGAALRRRRTELRLAQQDIADVIGVNRRVIGQLEAGKDTVQLKIALEAARAVGLDIELRSRGGAG